MEALENILSASKEKIALEGYGPDRSYWIKESRLKQLISLQAIKAQLLCQFQDHGPVPREMVTPFPIANSSQTPVHKICQCLLAQVCLRPKLTQQFSKFFALRISHTSALSPKIVQLTTVQLYNLKAILRVIDQNISKDGAHLRFHQE